MPSPDAPGAEPQAKGQDYGVKAKQDSFKQATQPLPPPELGAPPPEPTEKQVPNLHQLPDGTTMNLDEMLLSPTDRPDEHVATPIGGAGQQSITDLLQTMARSSSSPDVAALARIARSQGI